MQSFVVAVVIPEKKEIQAYAKQQGISGDYSDLLNNDQVIIQLCDAVTLLQSGFDCQYFWLSSVTSARTIGLT